LNSPEEKGPHSNISTEISKALANFNLIEKGDKVLIGVTGEKDSLCPRHFLKEFQ